MSAIATSPTTTLGTFWPLVYRFVWKEVRKMRGFAFGVAGLAALLMLLVSLHSEPVDMEEARTFMLLFCAFGGGAFVAIGAATTAFSVEREEQTDTFLLTLPRYWLATFVGKLLAILFLAVAFALGMSAVAWLIGGFAFPTSERTIECVKLGTVLLAEAAIWGLVVSLLVRRPLLAAVLACATTSFSSQFAMAVYGGTGYQTNDFLNALPYRWLLCGLGLVLATLLARRWVTDTDTTRSRSRIRKSQLAETIPAFLRRSMAASAIATLQPIGSTTRRAILGRLLWQTWRESWRVMLGVMGAGGLLMFSVQLFTPEIMGFERILHPLSLMSLTFIPGLCGALVFRQDHRRGQHQFLTEHAGRPHLVWIARVTSWGLYLALITGLVIALASVVFYQVIGRELQWTSSEPWQNIHIAQQQVIFHDFFYYGVLNALLAILVAFSLSQLSSLLLKSEILAAGLSVFVSMGIVMVSQVIWFWRLPPMWCLLPIALGALAATYFRIGDWLTARTSLARWSRVAAVAILPVAAIVVSIPAIRHAQIEGALTQIALAEAPHMEGQRWIMEAHPARKDPAAARDDLNRWFDVRVAALERKQHAAADVTQQYLNLLDEIHPSSADTSEESGEMAAEPSALSDDSVYHIPDFSNITDAQIEQIVELTKQPAAEGRKPSNWVLEVMLILGGDARHAIAMGKLDRAWDRILAIERLKRQLWHDTAPINSRTLWPSGTGENDLLTQWALAPKQTPIRIRDAIRDLMEVTADYPPLYYNTLANYVAARQTLDKGSFPPGYTLAPPPRAFALDDMPGEHRRAQLALRVFAMLGMQYAAQLEHAPQGESLRHQVNFVAPGPGVALWKSPQDTAERQLLWNTANSSLLAGEIWKSLSNQPYELQSALNQRAIQRLEQLRLLLIAHHLQHGAYPRTLDELVPYNDPELLGTVTTDTYSGDQFQYAPRIFEREMWSDKLWDAYAEKVDYAAPMIWSVGTHNYAKTPFRVDPRHHLPEAMHPHLKARYYPLELMGPVTSEWLHEPTVSAWQPGVNSLPLPADREYPTKKDDEKDERPQAPEEE